MENGKSNVIGMTEATPPETVSKSAELPLDAPCFAGSYQLLFEANPQPMWVYDLQTLRFLAVNDAALRHYGYARAEFLKLTIEQIRPPEDVAKLRALLSGRRFGFNSSMGWRHLKKNGEIIEVTVTSHPLDFGGREAVLALATDVTAQRRLEREAAEREERLRVIFEQANVGISRTDLFGRWLDVNDRVCEILGYRREELLGRTVQEFVHPADRAAYLDLDRRARDREIARFALELRFRRKSGTAGWTHLSFKLVLNAAGEPDYFVGILADISRRKEGEKALEEAREKLETRIEERTAELRGLNGALLKEIGERRQAEKALRESQELSRTVLDSLTEQIAVLDAAGNVIAVNKAWRKMGEEEGVLNSAIGANFLACCRQAVAAGEIRAGEAESGIKCVLDGSLSEFSFDYSCGGSEASRWFTLTAMPLSRDGGGAVISHAEITARHQAEAALRASHTLLRDIVEGTTDAVFVKDLQGRITMMNSAGAANLGRTVSDVIGKSSRDFFDAETARQIAAHDLETVKAGQTKTHKLKAKIRGQELDLLTTLGVCRSAEGEIVGLFGISRDITEINQAAVRLAQERSLLRTLIDNLPDGIFIKDRASRFLVSNAAHVEILRAATQAEVIGKTDFDFFPNEQAQRFFTEEQKLLATGEPLIERLDAVFNQRGETIWFLTTKVALRDSAGEIVGLVGAARDITERKRAHHQMMRLAAIVETSDDAIISTDVTGQIVSWNKAAAAIFGYSAEEMFGAEMRKLAPLERYEESDHMRAAVRRGETLKNVETIRQTKDGRQIHIAVTVSPILDENNLIVGASAIVRDITERKRMEREILEISDNEKRRIGQDLHDDLCQYLVGISLLGNVLHDNLRKNQRPEAADAQQINELVQQAVAKTRNIAKGLAPLDLAGAGFIHAIEDLALNMEHLFRIQCLFVCPAPVEIAETPVATHLYRIIQEAVHNAAKHSRGSQIVISITQGEGAIRLAVEDDGMGCPTDSLATSSTGLGWPTMQYRARMIGAQLFREKSALGGLLIGCVLSRGNGAR